MKDYKITSMQFPLIAAPFTPMKPNGEIDLDKIPDYARFLKKNGVSGAFICGSTGEGPSLSIEERKAIFQQWAHSKVEDFQLIAHVGDTNIHSAMEMAAFIAELGFDGLACVAPYYYRPDHVDDLMSITADIAEAAGKLPFYYYHIPILTNVSLQMSLYMEKAMQEIPSFKGLKYTYWDMMDFNRCVQLAKGQYEMFWGRDEALLAAICMGATGAVGSTYNYMAPLYLQMIKFFEEGKMQEARLLQEKAIRCIFFLGKYGGMGVGKAIMRIIGLDLGNCRPPVKNLPDRLLPELKGDLAHQDFFDHCNLI